MGFVGSPAAPQILIRIMQKCFWLRLCKRCHSMALVKHSAGRKICAINWYLRYRERLQKISKEPVHMLLLLPIDCRKCRVGGLIYIPTVVVEETATCHVI